MYRTASALTSAVLMLTATSAAAEETEPPPGPPPIDACGSMLTIEELKAQVNEHPIASGFVFTGNVVLRISDEDSSVVVRIPGRVIGEFTGTDSTITNTGHTLLISDPALPFQAEALAEAGLPEVPLIIGRVVIHETLDPMTGMPVDAEIDSVTGRVIDVCELLAR